VRRNDKQKVPKVERMCEGERQESYLYITKVINISQERDVRCPHGNGYEDYCLLQCGASINVQSTWAPCVSSHGTVIFK